MPATGPTHKKRWRHHEAQQIHPRWRRSRWSHMRRRDCRRRRQNSGFGDPDNWPQYHRSSNAWRFSPLTEINKDTVSETLKVAWITPAGQHHSTPGRPTPIAHRRRALPHLRLQQRVGAGRRHRHRPSGTTSPSSHRSPSRCLYAAASRGVTVGRGKGLHVGTLDGRFVAARPESSGERNLVNPAHRSEDPARKRPSSRHSPQLAGDVLFGGTTGGDQPIAACKIHAAYNADTGKTGVDLRHRQNDPASWPAGSFGKVGGGSARMPGAYDEKSDTIFIGTRQRGAGLLRRRSQRARWQHVTRHPGSSPSVRRPASSSGTSAGNPHDVWDFRAPPTRHSWVKKDGKDAIVHLNKSGFVFCQRDIRRRQARERSRGSGVRREHELRSKGIDPKTGALIEPRRPEPGKRELLRPQPARRTQLEPPCAAPTPAPACGYSHAKRRLRYAKWFRCPDDPTSLKALSALSLGIDEEIQVFGAAAKQRQALRPADARDPLTGKPKWSIRYGHAAAGAAVADHRRRAGAHRRSRKATCLPTTPTTANSCGGSTPASGVRGGPVSYAVQWRSTSSFRPAFGSYAPGFGRRLPADQGSAGRPRH